MEEELSTLEVKAQGLCEFLAGTEHVDLHARAKQLVEELAQMRASEAKVLDDDV